MKHYYPSYLSLRLTSLCSNSPGAAYDELKCFAKYDSRIEIALGVIDIKDLQIETPDMVASRLERGAKMIGADRLAAVPDCGLWMLPRSVPLGKLENLVRGRNLFAGH